MNAPKFISLEVVLELHSTSIAEFGGDHGTRDTGLVESALASAVNTFLYGNGDLFDIAAAYAFHLSESQAFIDGNKRTGLKAAISFLEVNGVVAKFGHDRVYDLTMKLANKQLNKSGFTEALRQMTAEQQ